ATVTGQVLFANGAPPQPFTTFFDVSENTKIQTVRTEPQLSINTNGAQILSVVNTDPPKYTGYKFYAKRQKRVGGEIVLTENNLVGIGQGPYYSPIRGDLYQECTLTTTSSGAYANNELYKEFVKNNCSGTSLGTKVSYHVPAGKYTSDVSQAAADQLALNEANQNGQAYANQNGFCYSNP
ncbi:MAG: hypothetical protein INR69_19090, partial [Mucilaginibacter polytrichastri]|nr:hypothetical protein [Mucilaginibacter polytrichastri]